MKMTGTYRPNDGHLYLAELEKSGKDVRVFTQNIDGLHLKAGSRHVYELHGSIQTAACPKCGRATVLTTFFKKKCQGAIASMARESMRIYIKTDVVLFGDAVQHFDTLLKSSTNPTCFW